MPYTRKRKAGWSYTRTRGPKRMKTGRRKTFRRSMKRFRRPRIQRNLGLVLPRTCFTKFKAVDTWQLNKSISLSPFMRFYSNNPYDPVYGTSTTKCTGFDDMMDIYKYGICYGFKINVRPVYSSNQPEIILYIQNDGHEGTNTGSILTLNQVTETNLVAKWRMLYSFNIMSDPAKIRPLRNYVKIKHLEHKRELETTNYQFSKSTGPNFSTVCALGAVYANSASTFDFSVRCFVQITYYCRLFEKMQMTE